MKTSEFVEFAKSDSMKNLIWASKIKTQSDIDALNKKEYAIGFTYDELKRILPERIAEKICYNNGLDKTFYYDSEKFVLFRVNLIGKQTFGTYDELCMDIMKIATQLENERKSRDYFPNLLLLNDKMRMEMLNILIEHDKLDKPYNAFLNFYQTSDYGCSEMSLESIKKIAESKSEEQRQTTAQKINNFSDKVIVYRGEGEKSSKLNDTVSWTTDINVATFFAVRFTGKEAKIHIAEVDKADIIEYFDREKECIILPEHIKFKGSIPVHGTKYFNEILPDIAPKYLEYRNYITDFLDFQIDDAEHGRLHTARVLLNALMIANETAVFEEDIERICLACVLHDVGRDNNCEDSTHGAKSAEIYKKLAEHDKCLFPYDETVEKLIRYHCLPDEVGKSAMSANEWMLYDIIKDADALDRVRFGIRDLDMNQLRTETAKTMVMIADLSVKGLQLPEPDVEQGMMMT